MMATAIWVILSMHDGRCLGGETRVNTPSTAPLQLGMGAPAWTAVRRYLREAAGSCGGKHMALMCDSWKEPERF